MLSETAARENARAPFGPHPVFPPAKRRRDAGQKNEFESADNTFLAKKAAALAKFMLSWVI
ncbi:MAG TPA: hypothetical protein IAA75_05285 [Candidatus Pullichristensenella avicola]|nr:hypothetical protein [Candidatus Pullichristensenella avicola]